METRKEKETTLPPEVLSAVLLVEACCQGGRPQPLNPKDAMVLASFIRGLEDARGIPNDPGLRKVVLLIRQAAEACEHRSYGKEEILKLFLAPACEALSSWSVNAPVSAQKGSTADFAPLVTREELVAHLNRAHEVWCNEDLSESRTLYELMADEAAAKLGVNPALMPLKPSSPAALREALRLIGGSTGTLPTDADITLLCAMRKPDGGWEIAVSHNGPVSTTIHLVDV